MHLDAQKLKEYCQLHQIRLADLLSRAKVSRTAYYSLSRQESVLPKSVHALATALNLKPSQILEEKEIDKESFKELMRQLQHVLDQNPDLEPDNVRHTLLLLRQQPIDRLRRSLTRAQKFNFYR